MGYPVGTFQSYTDKYGVTLYNPLLAFLPLYLIPRRNLLNSTQHRNLNFLFHSTTKSGRKFINPICTYEDLESLFLKVVKNTQYNDDQRVPFRQRISQITLSTSFLLNISYALEWLFFHDIKSRLPKTPKIGTILLSLLVRMVY